MTPTKSKNYKLATEFYDYCCAHPEMRFWQALRNWIEADFVYVTKTKEIASKDTFYWEGKNQ